MCVIYTLILQIIGTANNRDGFILDEFLWGKFKLTKYTNYRDGFLKCQGGEGPSDNIGFTIAGSSIL